MAVSAEALALWAKVRENHDKLSKCAGVHEFVKIPRVPGGSSIPQYRCSLCGGEVDHHAFTWYAHGLRDARKEPLRPPTP